MLTPEERAALRADAKRTRALAIAVQARRALDRTLIGGPYHLCCGLWVDPAVHVCPARELHHGTTGGESRATDNRTGDGCTGGRKAARGPLRGALI